MRLIGTLPGRLEADRFLDYLGTLGIDAEARLETAAQGRSPSSSTHGIWIDRERDVESARSELAAYAASPEDARYLAAAAAAELARKKAPPRADARARHVDVRRQWQSRPWTPVTIAVLAVSVAVAIATRLGEAGGPIVESLFISRWIVRTGSPVAFLSGLREIFSGEVWRLVTPVFLHFGLPHILFNALCLNNLGTAIEARRGSLRYGLLMLVLAVGSNLGQYLWTGDPRFGGLSGVVYGLFGYIWMHGRLHPQADMAMPHDMVVWGIGWAVLCVTGLMGPVANAAHGFGLAIGMAIGAIPALTQRTLRS